jgi:hypothetical protein
MLNFLSDFKAHEDVVLDINVEEVSNYGYLR